jgi:hypothetical protein
LGLRAGFAAFAAMLLCTFPSHAENALPEYGLVDHCEPMSALLDFEVWQRADSIIVARVSGDAEFSEEKWYEAEFQVEEVLLGDLKTGAKVTLFAHIGGKVSRESLREVLRRADEHESPEFIPFRLTRFPRYGYAAMGPEPEADCYPVPSVLRNVSYVIMRAGRRVLSVEPVFKPSDHWLRFLKALQEMNYWEWRASRQKSAGDADRRASGSLREPSLRVRLSPFAKAAVDRPAAEQFSSDS